MLERTVAIAVAVSSLPPLFSEERSSYWHPAATHLRVRQCGGSDGQA